MRIVTPRRVGDHQVAPVVQKLLQELAELQAFVGSLAEQLQRPGRIVLQDG